MTIVAFFLMGMVVCLILQGSMVLYYMHRGPRDHRCTKCPRHEGPPTPVEPNDDSNPYAPPRT